MRSNSIEVEIRRHRDDSPWSYSLLDQAQRRLAERIRTDGVPGKLYLSELSPVITLGRRTRPEDLYLDPQAYSARGIEILKTDRGGLATYHGPGQWVAFAVDRLDRLTGDPRGVRKAVEGLLEAALEAAQIYRPEAQIREGNETGVWGRHGKIASVGVHIEQGVLLHGVAINGFSTPESFFGLRPCGLDAQPEFLLNDPKDFELLGKQIQTAVLGRFWHSA